jgi:hypothetical protein
MTDLPGRTPSPEAAAAARAVLDPTSVYSAGSAYQEARVLARAILDLVAAPVRTPPPAVENAGSSSLAVVEKDEPDV